MCGIVGYYGPLNPKDVIVAGLKRLEYRGYDSAGVAILHDGKLKRIRVFRFFRDTSYSQGIRVESFLTLQ